MSKLLLAILSVLAVSAAHAQSFKVIKIQGRKAIVEMSDPTMVNLNQTYDVGGSSSMSSGPTSFKRDYAIAATFSYLSTSSPSASVMNLGGMFLWNMKAYEFGPTASLTNTTVGSTSTSSSRFGAIGYYNFNDNKVGVETVMSAVGSVEMSSGSGSSVTYIELGGNYRWFMLSGDHCFSFSALYQMAQASGSSTSGFALEGGIMTYF